MVIKQNTEMMLFRYNNYKGYSFIKEHLSVYEKHGYVWMLKVGKRSSEEKIKRVLDDGGWIILRSPKAEGGKSYIARFTKKMEVTPEGELYPAYYQKVLNAIENEDTFYFSEPTYQWFRIEFLSKLPEDCASSLIISNSGKKVDDIISSTRTAVMFVRNDKQFLF